MFTFRFGPLAPEPQKLLCEPDIQVTAENYVVHEIYKLHFSKEVLKC